MEISKEVLKGHIDSIILSIISKRDNYGYEIIKEVKGMHTTGFTLKEGTMYLSLKRLEKKQYIESYWEDGKITSYERGRRKYYKITKIGMEVLEERKREWLLIKELMIYFLEEVGNERDK